MNERPALASLRAILMTGKGGVGKSTLSAALATALAKTGLRVLCTELVGSPDADSPLARILGITSAGTDPVYVSDRLSFARIEPSTGHLSFLRAALPMKVMADAAMKSSAIRRFLMAAPSLPEMGALYRLLELTEDRLSNGEFRYQTLVVDLPATGHAVALAQIPASILNVIERGPIADAVRRGLELLYDPKKTGAIIVTLPETLPVSESLELGASLQKHGIPLRGIVLNKVPWNPFSDAEIGRVEDALGNRGAVLGSRLFGRIGRANTARARLGASSVPLLAELTEQQVGGDSLVASLMSLIVQC